MIERPGDLWDVYDRDVKFHKDHFIVIPTNGIVKKNGQAVMGAGLAKDIALKMETFPLMLGNRLKFYGNIPHSFSEVNIITFPTKHHWYQEANIDLIEVSALELANCVRTAGYKRIYMPRVGCGNGRLSWDVVRPVLIEYLDNRFIIVHKEAA